MGRTSSVIPSGCHLPLEGEGCGGAACPTFTISAGATIGRPPSGLFTHRTGGRFVNRPTDDPLHRRKPAQASRRSLFDLRRSSLQHQSPQTHPARSAVRGAGAQPLLNPCSAPSPARAECPAPSAQSRSRWDARRPRWRSRRRRRRRARRRR